MVSQDRYAWIVDVGILGRVPFGEARGLKLGARTDFHVTDVSEDANRLVLSACCPSTADILSSYPVGTRCTVAVTATCDFGVFVSDGLVSGLVHISELAHHRISDVSDEVEIGEEFDVEVSEVDVEASRLSFSRSSSATSLEVWTADHRVGDTVVGRIRTIVNFGAFVNIGEIDGLLHYTDIPGAEHARVHDVLREGAQVEVVVSSVDTARKRVTLVLSG